MSTPDGEVFVRVRSHRARKRLISLLGREPQGWFSFRELGEWRTIPRGMAREAREIPGVTVARKVPADIMKCIDW